MGKAVGALVDGAARGRAEVEGSLRRLTPEERRSVARATVTNFLSVALIADSLDEREARRVVAVAAKVDRARLAWGC